MFENNQVSIIGELRGELIFNHSVNGEGFYVVEVAVKRQSGTIDRIPVMISERLVNIKECYVGRLVEIQGQFRSYNYHEKNKSHLKLSVFVKEIFFLDGIDPDVDPNYIFLDGYICKPPTYRNTTLGREIADILLAVNRPYGKSDYIPCICWGRNARFAGNLEVGNHVLLCGRIQSREYQKKIAENEIETRIAYEVSVAKIIIGEESEQIAN